MVGWWNSNKKSHDEQLRRRAGTLRVAREGTPVLLDFAYAFVSVLFEAFKIDYFVLSMS